jgi:hypothetical protein
LELHLFRLLVPPNGAAATGSDPDYSTSSNWLGVFFTSTLLYVKVLHEYYTRRLARAKALRGDASGCTTLALIGIVRVPGVTRLVLAKVSLPSARSASGRTTQDDQAW